MLDNLGPGAPGQRSPTPWITFAVAAAALLAAGLVAYATALGAGTDYDAINYASMATEIRAGHAPSNVHFPPGLPAMLAVGEDPFAVARVLNALALAGLVAVTGAAVWRTTLAGVATVLAAVGVALAEPVLVEHAMAHSEPLALVLGHTGLLLVLVALERERAWTWSAAGLFLGLAATVRYAAVVYALAAVAFVLTERRWRAAALLSVVSLLPLGAWLLRNLLTTHAATDRSFVYHPIPRRTVELGRQVVGRWVDPLLLVSRGSPRVQWMLVAVVGALLAWGWWRGGRLGRLAAMLGVGHVAFLLFVIAFMDAGSVLDTRLLLPAFVASVWVAAALLVSVMRRSMDARRPFVRAFGPAVAVLACAFVLTHARVGLARCVRAHGNGIGAASARWRTSPLVKAIDALPAGSVVWTNDRLEVGLFTQAAVRPLPAPLLYTTHEPWDGYADALAAIRAGAYVAEFTTSPSWVPGAVTDLERTRGLDTLEVTRDGTLYRVR